MRRLRPAALAGALVLAAGPVAAQSGAPADRAAVDPVTRMSMHVSTYVFDRLLKLVPRQKAMRLLMIAKQQSLALNCEGFELDPTKFNSNMEDALAELRALAPAGQENLALDNAIAAYSVALGGEMAVAAYDMDAYCAIGAQVREELLEDTEGKVGVLRTDG